MLLLVLENVTSFKIRKTTLDTRCYGTALVKKYRSSVYKVIEVRHHFIFGTYQVSVCFMKFLFYYNTSVGRGEEELTAFLSQHPDTFKITNGKVLLLKHDDFNYVPIPERSCSHQPTTDDRKANKEMVRFNQYHEPWPNLCESNLPNIVYQSTTTTRRQYFIDDNWKAVIVKNTKVISTVADSRLVTNDILNGITANDQAVVSFNCKVTIGDITLMAIGTRSGKAFLFDVLQCPQMMSRGGLKALLEDDRVIKVMHDCSYESATLHRQFQTLLTNVFDTKRADCMLQYQGYGTRLNKTKIASFRSLIGSHYAPLNPLKEGLLMHSQQLWKIRPLTREMIIYAARNVLLLDEQLYGSMAS